jgi:hypothetical protein
MSSLRCVDIGHEVSLTLQISDIFKHLWLPNLVELLQHGKWVIESRPDKTRSTKLDTYIYWCTSLTIVNLCTFLLKLKFISIFTNTQQLDSRVHFLVLSKFQLHFPAILVWIWMCFLNIVRKRLHMKTGNECYNVLILVFTGSTL